MNGKRGPPVVALSSPVVWDDREHIQTTFIDISERLSVSGLPDYALNEVPTGISIADITRDDQPLIYINDMFVELTGYPREEVIGTNCRFLQGERTREEPVAKMRAAIEAREPVTVVLRNYRKDGSMFWNRVTLTPITDETGTVRYYLGFQEDVSEQKLYEKEQAIFKKHAEAAEQAIFITDRAGTIEYVNPTFERMTGYSAEEAIGQSPRLIKSDQQDDRFYTELWETITAGNIWEAEVINRTKSGELYKVHQQIVPITNDRGEITHFAAIERDVTDTRFAEQVLDVMNRVLRHNVRTSVNVIDGYAELLANNIEDPELRAAARIIRERSEVLEKISDRTAEIQGLFKRRKDAKSLPVGNIVEFVERNRQQYPEADIDVQINANTDMEIKNGGLLQSAIDEAIENAVVHNDQPVAKIEVRVCKPEETADVHIEIADNGPGIPSAEWEIITVGEETPLVHSSGIGLWLIYWTVTALGGAVELTENDPRGSVLTYRVPVVID